MANAQSVRVDGRKALTVALLAPMIVGMIGRRHLTSVVGQHAGHVLELDRAVVNIEAAQNFVDTL